MAAPAASELVEQWLDQAQRLLDYHADTRLIGVQAAALGVGALVLTCLAPARVSE